MKEKGNARFSGRIVITASTMSWVAFMSFPCGALASLPCIHDAEGPEPYLGALEIHSSPGLCQYQRADNEHITLKNSIVEPRL